MDVNERKVCLAVLRPDEPDDSSGTAEILKRNCELLSANGYEIELVTPPNEPLIELLGEHLSGVSIIGSAAGKRSVGRNLIGAYKIFKKMKPALVHFHCPNSRWGLDVVWAAGLAGVPYIIRTEQNPLMAMPELPVRVLLWLADRKVSKFVYNCIGNRARFDRFLPYRSDRGHVIVNCIDPEDMAFLEEDETTRESLRGEFGFPVDSQVALFAAGGFGLYHAEKPRPLRPVLRAFKKLIDNPETYEIAKNWRLLVLGDGDERAPDAVEDMGLGDYVHFAGHRSDFIRVLSQCDLVVSASHYEGSALTTFKAWALNVPTLITQVDGISDVIGEDDFRRLMVKHQDIDAYAEAWYEFMLEEPYRMAVHKKAGEIVLAEYTVDKWKQRYLDVYNSLFSQG